MKFHAICENHLYSKAYSKGKRAVTPAVAVYVLPDYTAEALQEQLAAWDAQGHKRIAVITRTQKEAVALSAALPKAALLTGDVDELEETGVILAGLNLMKGLEFDAVAVVWPDDAELTDDERRRRYTACSRALHSLTVFKL